MKIILPAVALVLAISTGCNSVQPPAQLEIQASGNAFVAYPQGYAPGFSDAEYNIVECHNPGINMVCPPVPTGNDYRLSLRNLSREKMKQLYGQQGYIEANAFNEKTVLIPSNAILELEKFDPKLRSILGSSGMEVHAAAYNKYEKSIEYWLEQK